METWARERTRFIFDPIANSIGKLGITPNTITVMSLLLNLVAAVLIAKSYIFWGGMLMAFVAMPLDALDGTLARAMNQETKFGAFLDSVLDRFSEAAICLGLIALFVQSQDTWAIFGCSLAMFGSVMVSYTRARAEGLGIECRVGILTRLVRVIVMAIGLIGNVVVFAIWTLAVLSLFTSIQRIAHVYHTTRTEE
ncbi:CDP-alcohol phosphatidyltransferase family protein [[Phormidium] sp. ETS-05]|uniref:CDP-alcohol phosphatidyltransferase family protein n=1 Tax=[Phormidium] sp. ETS-05 TaxID=222819 RepID=UPI0018EEE5F5|nr:CDP-alcohol phosphatidyltransferase family protein [[Phormidium] sp. ETS-05]